MIRKTWLALALVVSSALPALAQHAIAPPAPDSATQQLVGTWEGTFETDHGAGTFRLVVAHDTAWSAVGTLLHDGQEIPTAITDFNVKGNNISWTQAVMGMSCKASSTLTAGTLRGESNCGNVAMSYLLRKK